MLLVTTTRILDRSVKRIDTFLTLNRIYCLKKSYGANESRSTGLGRFRMLPSRSPLRRSFLILLPCFRPGPAGLDGLAGDLPALLRSQLLRAGFATQAGKGRGILPHF